MRNHKNLSISRGNQEPFWFGYFTSKKKLNITGSVLIHLSVGDWIMQKRRKKIVRVSRQPRSRLTIVMSSR